MNLTTGPGGRYHSSDDNPAVAGPTHQPSATAATRREHCRTAARNRDAGPEYNDLRQRDRHQHAPQRPDYGAGHLRLRHQAGNRADIELARDMFADRSLHTPAMVSLVLGR